MNKKQVGAFLKVVGKDDMHPNLMQAKVDRYDGKLGLVGTNGYMLAVVFLDEDAEEIEGKVIRRDALERWYKLATGKDRLTGQELVRLSAEDYANHDGYSEHEFVPWQKAVPSNDPVPQTTMRFNAEFFKIMQDLTGNADMTVKLYGEVHPMVIESEDGVFVVMPMKRV